MDEIRRILYHGHVRRRLSALRAILLDAGYLPDLVREGTAKAADIKWLAGYGRLPTTPRNACVAAIASEDAALVAEVLDATGAAIALALDGDDVAVWHNESTGPRKALSLQLDELSKRAQSMLDPRSIHRAKTLGRFDGTYQMWLVDSGLLPRIEQAQGEELQRLLERIVAELRQPDDSFSAEHGHQILTIAFWILAARMLQDHKVVGFDDLGPEGHKILPAVANHYGGAIPSLAGGAKWKKRIDKATRVAWNFGMNLREIGPEAISYVYESSLIAKQTRRDLGTHSTPPFMVEYVLGRLRSSIQQIPIERRMVVEPACGHGAFLVAALRILAEDIPSGTSRHKYLQARLRGLEIDHAAKEMARLSLTIADIPNADGWDIREGDMFETHALVNLAQGGTILLANAPFEDLSAEERRRIDKTEEGPALTNKSAEMLRRILPALEPDAVMGIIIPRQLLHGSGDSDLRRMILSRFQLIEICVFPDRVFRFAGHECAVLLAKGQPGGTKRGSPVRFRRVRENGIDAFRLLATVSDEETVPGSLFLDDPDISFLLPELRRLWASRAWQTLGEVASAQQGLSYHGWVQADGHATVRHQRFPRSARGVAGPKQSRECSIFDELPYVYMDTDPLHIRRALGGLPTGSPQVVLNTHPHSRGPWRLKAYIDWEGAALPSTRISVRARNPSISVEVLWAICNSPVANAFVYSHMSKRDIAVKQFEALPIPYLNRELHRTIRRLVRMLFAAAKLGDEQPLSELTRRLDALILGAYGLFAPAEQRLCSLFRGYERPGLPFVAKSLGEPGRLPLYLGVGDLSPCLPPPSLGTRLTLVTDLDAEIDDGRRELAELRRRQSDDERVSARIQYVRGMLHVLEEYAALKWIPDESGIPPDMDHSECA